MDTTTSINKEPSVLKSEIRDLKAAKANFASALHKENAEMEALRNEISDIKVKADINAEGARYSCLRSPAAAYLTAGCGGTWVEITTMTSRVCTGLITGRLDA